jgi:hypothetical protein
LRSRQHCPVSSGPDWSCGMSLTDLLVCGAVLVGCVALALTVVRLA